MRVKGGWTILDEDGPGGGGGGEGGGGGGEGDAGGAGGDSDGGGGSSDGGGGGSGDSSDQGGSASGDAMATGGDVAIHGTSVFNAREDVSASDGDSRSGEANYGVNHFSDDGDGINSSQRPSRNGNAAKDTSNDHWGFGASEGELGFVSLGPLALGGAYSYGAAQFGGPTEAYASAFVGGLGIAYAVGLSPSVTASYRSAAPQQGAGFECDPALMIITPIFNVIVSLPKSDNGADRGLDVSISIGLTFGAGFVGGVYCGGAVDTPPLANKLRDLISPMP